MPLRFYLYAIISHCPNPGGRPNAIEVFLPGLESGGLRRAHAARRALHAVDQP